MLGDEQNMERNPQGTPHKDGIDGDFGPQLDALSIDGQGQQADAQRPPDTDGMDEATRRLYEIFAKYEDEPESPEAKSSRQREEMAAVSKGPPAGPEVIMSIVNGVVAHKTAQDEIERQAQKQDDQKGEEFIKEVCQNIDNRLAHHRAIRQQQLEDYHERKVAAGKAKPEDKPKPRPPTRGQVKRENQYRREQLEGANKKLEAWKAYRCKRRKLIRYAEFTKNSRLRQAVLSDPSFESPWDYQKEQAPDRLDPWDFEAEIDEAQRERLIREEQIRMHNHLVRQERRERAMYGIDSEYEREEDMPRGRYGGIKYLDSRCRQRPPRKLYKNRPPERWGEIPSDKLVRGAPRDPGTEQFWSSMINEERKLRCGLMGFVQAGRALRTIWKKSLWAPYYRSFKEYIELEWAMSKSHAYRLMASCEVVDVIYQRCADCDVLPVNEAQVRPLTQLRLAKGTLLPHEIEAVWREAIRTSGRDRWQRPTVSVVHIEMAARMTCRTWDRFKQLNRSAGKTRVSVSIHDPQQALKRLMGMCDLNYLTMLGKLLKDHIRRARAGHRHEAMLIERCRREGWHDPFRTDPLLWRKDDQRRARYASGEPPHWSG